MPRFTFTRSWGILAVLAGMASAGEARAALHCQEPAVRLGDVRAGVPLARSFELVNRGSAIVDVTEVRPSCGCLNLKLDRPRLQPGEFAVLRLDINTLTQPAGLQTWRIRLAYRD